MPLGRGLTSYLIALVIIALDQATKAYIVHGLHMTPGMSHELFGPVRFTFVYNTGFSFGMMQDTPWSRWGLSAFSAIVSVFLVVWARRVTRPLLAIGIGLILGGAVGNLIDRVTIGRVIDFMNLGEIFPWIFNVADAGINIGVVFLILDVLLAPKQQAPSPTGGG